MAQNVDKFREYGQAALCRLNNVRKVQFVKQICLSLSLLQGAAGRGVPKHDGTDGTDGTPNLDRFAF